jgi:hypothetical protein
MWRKFISEELLPPEYTKQESGRKLCKLHIRYNISQEGTQRESQWKQTHCLYTAQNKPTGDTRKVNQWPSKGTFSYLDKWEEEGQ